MLLFLFLKKKNPQNPEKNPKRPQIPIFVMKILFHGQLSDRKKPVFALRTMAFV